MQQERKFRKLIALSKGQNLKLVVGSSEIHEAGWLPSEAHFLDLTKAEDWTKYFKESSVDVILGEHVWEHLTPEQGKQAAGVCYRFLKKGGRLRVAVPDGFHGDENYINYVKPGGHGAGADDHKILYTYKTFSAIFEQAGFQVELLEYFDENRNFHRKEWDKKDGFVRRSIRYDERNADGKPNYTSLILDAIKV